MNFPALNGETVTEAHTKICAERGHATHTVDGADTGRCPRCGNAKIAEYQIVAKFVARRRGLAYEIHKMDTTTGRRVDVLDTYPTEEAAQADVARLQS